MFDELDLLVKKSVDDFIYFVAYLGPRLIKARDNKESFNLSPEEVNIILSVGLIASFFVILFIEVTLYIGLFPFGVTIVSTL